MDSEEEAKASRLPLGRGMVRLRIWQPDSRIDGFGYRRSSLGFKTLSFPPLSLLLTLPFSELLFVLDTKWVDGWRSSWGLGMS